MSDELRPTGPHFSDPFEPAGDGMGANAGPGAYADRPDRPDLTVEGEPRFVPARTVENARIPDRDPDPVGMTVVGCNGVPAGRVRDFWIDRAEPQVRYYELELEGEADGADGPDTTSGPVLLPVGFVRLNRRRGLLMVKAIRAEHFHGVPRPARPDRVTLAEEDRIVAYYGGGYLYAEDDRAEPFI